MSATRREAVLVLEDSDDDFGMVVEAAVQSGIVHELVQAVTVDEARNALAGPYRFDLVLLDNSLPGNHGVDFLRELRSNSNYGFVPVVAFTATARMSDRHELDMAGINAVHVKSVRYEQNLWTLNLIFTYWLKAAASTLSTDCGA